MFRYFRPTLLLRSAKKFGIMSTLYSAVDDEDRILCTFRSFLFYHDIHLKPRHCEASTNNATCTWRKLIEGDVQHTHNGL
jgi:hypothetical protein